MDIYNEKHLDLLNDAKAIKEDLIVDYETLEEHFEARGLYRKLDNTPVNGKKPLDAALRKIKNDQR